ncbi:MAG: hypothetical protein JWQ84_3672 [Mucilaginibacter sp.]|nr:hypothetical protein [Mucilaginibacter sp.]
MTVKFLQHKWQKVTAVISIIVISLILIIAIFINNYWSPILAAKVKDVVSTSSDGLYNVDFSDAELHVLRGSVVIYNITLKPDTAVYNRKKEQHLAPNNLVELHIKRLTILHIHPFTLYFQHRLEIGEIILNNPELNVSYQLNHTKDTVVKDNRTPWQKISKSLHSIHIGNIVLGDVKFRYEDYSGNKVAISTLKEMNLSAHDLLIDSATQTDRSRLLYCKDVIAELNNYTAKSTNGLYTYHINHLKLSTLKSQLDVEGLTLKPVGSNTFFSKSKKDKFTMHLDSVRLNHFDFLNYHKYRILNASSLVLSKGNIEIFGNPNITQPKTDRVATFPNVGLFKINADMKIDTVRVNHINVVYTEYNKKSNKTGSISFNNTSGRFLNVTTNPAALQKNNISAIQLSSYFMNRGKLNLWLTFNLTDKNNSFTCKGTLGSMDLKAVNSAIMPLTMVKITSGKLRQLDFDLKADKEKARGKVDVLYNDLKVTILKADTTHDNLKSQTIASFYANTFIIKHDNPDIAGGQPRVFYTDYSRTFEIPFFKFVWQTLLSGIKPSVGLNKQTQDAATAMISKQAINKQNHKIKKEQRKERRAARRAKRAEKKLEKSEA